MFYINKNQIIDSKFIKNEDNTIHGYFTTKMCSNKTKEEGTITYEFPRAETDADNLNDMSYLNFLGGKNK